MSVKMPGLLNYWSVDELAECLDGVGKELYAKLWSYIPEKGDGPTGADVWNELTEEQQQRLADAVYREFPDLKAVDEEDSL